MVTEFNHEVLGKVTVKLEMFKVEQSRIGDSNDFEPVEYEWHLAISDEWSTGKAWHEWRELRHYTLLEESFKTVHDIFLKMRGYDVNFYTEKLSSADEAEGMVIDAIKEMIRQYFWCAEHKRWTHSDDYCDQCAEEGKYDYECDLCASQPITDKNKLGSTEQEQVAAT